jgi:hypothetical protein
LIIIGCYFYCRKQIKTDFVVIFVEKLPQFGKFLKNQYKKRFEFVTNLNIK